MQLVPGDRLVRVGLDVGDEGRLAGADHLRRAASLARLRWVPVLELAREDHLRGVDVLDGDRRDLTAGVDDVDRAPVGDAGNGELRDRLQARAPVERERQLRARVEQEALRLLDPLAVVDVRRGADPEVDLPALLADRHRPAEMPAVRAVRGAEAVLDLEDVAVAKRLLPPGDDGRKVVGMRDARPRRVVDLVARHPGVVEPALVVVGREPARVGRPDDLRHGVGELAVALGALTAQLGELPGREQLGLRADLLVLLPQLDEDVDLRAQDLRVERLEDVVDRADLVPAEDVAILLREGGQEDNRDHARALALLDHLGDLEAVEVGHLDVEQDDREVVAVEQDAQRFRARSRVHELVAERLEDRAQRDQVLRAVVDEQQRGHQAWTFAVPQSSTSSCAISAVRATRAPGTAAIAASGISSRVASAGSWTIAVPPSSNTRASPCAPSSFAPVKTTPTQRSRYDSAALSSN